MRVWVLRDDYTDDNKIFIASVDGYESWAENRKNKRLFGEYTKELYTEYHGACVCVDAAKQLGVFDDTTETVVEYELTAKKV